MHGQAPAPFRVGIDGFNLAMPRGTGVATYGRMLSRALKGMGFGVDALFGLDVGSRLPDLMREMLFFDRLDSGERRPAPRAWSPRWLREAAGAARGLDAAEVPVTGRVLAGGFVDRLPAFDRLLNVPGLFEAAERHFRRTRRFLTVRIPDPPDVMHWTYPLPIRLHAARNVYTLHDLVPLRMPFATLDNKRAYLRLVQGCVRVGDRVCTVSEASRADILTLLGANPDTVVNTYQTAGLPQPPVPDEELAGWLGRLFGLRRDGYWLFYASVEPKKNVGRMVEAFLASGVAGPLVLVGGRSWRAEDALRLVGPASGERVRLLDHVPAGWLAALVLGARAVLFPSLYEGFGLPVLEAMQLGTPVLTSIQASLPEVAGDAALLVDPYDVAGIAIALQSLDRDDAVRKRLAERGPLQATKFDLARYQLRLGHLYAGLGAVRRSAG